MRVRTLNDPDVDAPTTHWTSAEKKIHADCTILHIMGSIEDIDDDVSAIPVLYHKKLGPCPSDVFDCGDEHLLEELMFLQPHELNTLEKNQQNMSSKRGIPITWMLLDSQSTVDVFFNADLLETNHKSVTTLTIRCNAGVKSTNWKGHLPDYGWVWYYLPRRDCKHYVLE